MTEQEVLQKQVDAYDNRIKEANKSKQAEQDYLKNNYLQAVRSNKRDRNDAYRNAYAQRRQTNKYLGQSLAQMGIRGGMSETARMNAYNNEQNARNSAYSDYLNNKASLYNAYQQNMMNSNNNWNNTIYGLEDNQMNAQLTLAQYLANQGGGSGGYSSGGGDDSTPIGVNYSPETARKLQQAQINAQQKLASGNYNKGDQSYGSKNYYSENQYRANSNNGVTNERQLGKTGGRTSYKAYVSRVKNSK